MKPEWNHLAAGANATGDFSLFAATSSMPAGKPYKRSLIRRDFAAASTAKAYDPDGGECECKWMLADSILASECNASVLLDTGRYVIVLRVTDDEQQWAADTLNAVISRCVIPPAIDTSYDFLTTLGCMSDYDHLAGDPLIYLYRSLSEILLVLRPSSSSSAS